jgi:capsular polysaccharide biosynthesis protein
MNEMGSGAEPAELQGGSWLRPATEDNDLRRYLTTLRERRLLILVCVVISALVALAYVEISTPVYQAQAGLLIVPADVSGDITLTGLPLIQASSDPTRDVETAAELIATTDVAAGVKAALRLHGTPQQILNKVTVVPVAQSNIVAVTATGSSARSAAQLANGFATGVVAQRTALFDRRLDQQIALLTQRIATSPSLGGRLGGGLSQLQTLRTAPLPDMRVATLAQPPTAPSSPKKRLSIVVGIISGLLIGIVAAFAVEGLDPRVHREEQLRRLFHLPVLARIPREGAAGGMARSLARVPLIGELARWSLDRRSQPRSPLSLSPAGLDGYRTLRATLLASRPIQPRSILVTGAGPWEGKTTTAINLAVSLAWSGASVILIEADLRRPSIGGALGLKSQLDLSHVLTGQVSLERALVQPPEYGENLRILLAGGHGMGSAFVGIGVARERAGAGRLRHHRLPAVGGGDRRARARSAGGPGTARGASGPDPDGQAPAPGYAADPHGSTPGGDRADWNRTTPCLRAVSVSVSVPGCRLAPAGNPQEDACNSALTWGERVRRSPDTRRPGPRCRMRSARRRCGGRRARLVCTAATARRLAGAASGLRHGRIPPSTGLSQRARA